MKAHEVRQWTNQERGGHRFKDEIRLVTLLKYIRHPVDQTTNTKYFHKHWYTCTQEEEWKEEDNI